MVLVHVTLIPLWGSRRKDGCGGRGDGIGPSIMLYFHLTVSTHVLYLAVALKESVEVSTGILLLIRQLAEMQSKKGYLVGIALTIYGSSFALQSTHVCSSNPFLPSHFPLFRSSLWALIERFPPAGY